MILEETEGPLARKPRSNVVSKHLLSDLPSMDGLSIERDPLLYGSNDITSLTRSLVFERTLVETVSLTENRSLFDMAKEVEGETGQIMNELIEVRNLRMKRK